MNINGDGGWTRVEVLESSVPGGEPMRGYVPTACLSKGYKKVPVINGGGDSARFPKVL